MNVVPSSPSPSLQLTITAGCQSMMGGDKPIVAIAEMKPHHGGWSSEPEPNRHRPFSRRWQQQGAGGGRDQGTETELRARLSRARGAGPFGRPEDRCPLQPGRPSAQSSQPDPAHAGAMFNLKTDSNGTGTTQQTVDTITLTPGKYSIVGNAVDHPPRPRTTTCRSRLAMQGHA